jgi:hypothetical protein
MKQHPLVGLGLLIIEASRSHSGTPYSIELLCKNDQPNAENFVPDNTQHVQRQATMIPAAFEPTIPASERPQTHSLDRAAIGIGDIQAY